MCVLLIVSVCAFAAELPPSTTDPSADPVIPKPSDYKEKRTPEWVFQAPDKKAFAPGRASADPVLAAMLHSPDARVRQDAIEGLGAAKCQKTVDLCLVALADPDRGVREAAVQALLKQEPDVLAKRALDGLASGRDDLWSGICTALPRLRKPIEGRLLGILSEEKADPGRRMLAAYALGAMRSRKALRPLRELAWNGAPGLSAYCAQALAAMGDPAAIRDVAALTEHADPAVRLAAVSALGQAGGNVARSTLEAVASSPNEPALTVRAEAVKLLGTVGGESSVPLLIDTMRQHRGIGEQVAETLQKLTGQEFGDNPERWGDWYRQLLEDRGLAPSPTLEPEVVDLSGVGSSGALTQP